MTSPATKRPAPTSFKNQIFSPALKTQKLDNGAVSITTILDEMKCMETRLQLHADQLFTRLTIELTAVEEKLLHKIESEIKIIQERVHKFEDRIVSIESELATVKKLTDEIETLKKEMHEFKTTKETTTVKDISADAIIFGIAFEKSENLKSIFNQVCRHIDFLAPQVRDIFRVRPKTSQEIYTAVIVKFYTPFDRNRTLKAFSEYRKRTKGSVSMRAAGFNSDKTFRIYESLSAENTKILQLAIKKRIAGKFWSVFSAKGKVYVRLAQGSEAVHVPNEKALDDFISG